MERHHELNRPSRRPTSLSSARPRGPRQILTEPHQVDTADVTYFLAYVNFCVVDLSLLEMILYYFGRSDLWLLLCFDPTRRQQLWRFLSVMLTHASQLHLGSNVFCQLILGIPLERMHGGLQTAVIIIGGVVFGSLALTIFSPTEYAVGASGGVSALLGAHYINIIFNWSKTNCSYEFFWSPLVLTFLTVLRVSEEDEILVNWTIKIHVNHGGHLGGLMGGAVISLFLLTNLRKNVWGRTLQIIIGVVTIVVIAAIVYINFNWSWRYSRTENNRSEL